VELKSKLFLIDQLLNLEKRHTHFDAQIFNFFATGNYTAVIVTEHSNRFANQIRPEYTLTTYVKIVAIN
jgi:hypothetical protein